MKGHMISKGITCKSSKDKKTFFNSNGHPLYTELEQACRIYQYDENANHIGSRTYYKELDEDVTIDTIDYHDDNTIKSITTSRGETEEFEKGDKVYDYNTDSLRYNQDDHETKVGYDYLELTDSNGGRVGIFGKDLHSYDLNIFRTEEELEQGTVPSFSIIPFIDMGNE